MDYLGMAMRILLLMLLAFAVQVASAEMWKCADQNGNIRYTNMKTDAKGCKALNLEPVNTVPATPVRTQQKPANFPSVDNYTQRQRDAGRRKILEQELTQEQQQLEVARKQLAEEKDVRLGNERNYARVEERLKPYEDRVKLHENNVESLKKEIGNAK
jgi:Na+-transporting methylmalonyl-CoA/oxaloacetate decarboxylase gamma subunit